MTLSEMIEKIENKFTDKHAHCIATDAEYTDKEMVEILSNYIKSSFEEDLKSLRESLTSLAQQIREETEDKSTLVGSIEFIKGAMYARKEVEKRWNNLYERSPPFCTW